MQKKQPPLLLASASPRRRQLITQLGLSFMVAVAPGNEDSIQPLYQGPSTGLAQWTASYKAFMMFTRPEITHSIVITADTTVVLDDQVLNKPRNEAHARELLLSLRGRWHQVVTGVVVSSLLDGELQMHGANCTTPVLMRSYTEEEIDLYIASGDPMDKAGAYGIQSTLFQPTERIDGCYYNVVGLPLCTLTSLLAKFQIYPTTETCLKTGCPWSEHCKK